MGYGSLIPDEIRFFLLTTSFKWLPRNGIATPAQIVYAVQEGVNLSSLYRRTISKIFSNAVFNMGNNLAIFLTYATMLVDGNLVTNLLSIGGKTPETGPDPPPPAVVGGLDTHALFEGTLLLYVQHQVFMSLLLISGDTSMTRGKRHYFM
jgi:hypothetical protein